MKLLSLNNVEDIVNNWIYYSYRPNKSGNHELTLITEKLITGKRGSITLVLTTEELLSLQLKIKEILENEQIHSR